MGNNEIDVNNFTVARRTRLACFGLTCGVPVALGRFVYQLAFRSGTKTFAETATDNEVEAFCRGPDAMAVKSVVICKNLIITGRCMTAIGRCFWIINLDVSGCKAL